MSKNFIAIDSEGRTLETGEHITVLIMASTGYFKANDNGLDSTDIFNFLIDLKIQTAHLKPIFVIYGASYDFNMFLRHIPEQLAREINADHQNDEIVLRYWGDFGIKYMPRKFLEIITKEASITIYDCIGFYQMSFVEAVKNTLPEVTSSKEFNFMVRGKDSRADFNEWNLQSIIEYTTIELDYLVEMMDKLESGLLGLGLNLRQYHGAGAIASAMLKKRIGKKFICKPLPNVVERAACLAYFGGRIELFNCGTHTDLIYEADINSAYPRAIADIIPTDNCKWDCRGYNKKIITQEFLDSCSEFGIYEIEWECPDNQRICPFPYRSDKQKKVFYPTKGRGSYHKVEIQAALGHCTMYAITAIHLIPQSEEKIFSWVWDDYQTRADLTAIIKKTGIPNSIEKIIKLGLNSLYGKICQTTGGKQRRPPWHNIFWAGYITAFTRAKVFEAMMTCPDSIIMAATDGVYSVKELDLDYSDKKELGKWDKGILESGIFIQSGYYFLKSGGKWKAKTRGFDKLKSESETMFQIDRITQMYHYGVDHAFFPCTRFITLATACTGKNYDKWCTWYEMRQGDTIGRKLALTPQGTKRVQTTICNLSKEIADTLPLINATPNVNGAAYKRGWLDETESEDNRIIEELIEYGYTD